MCATRSQASHWWAAHTDRQTQVAHGELYILGLCRTRAGSQSPLSIEAHFLTCRTDAFFWTHRTTTRPSSFNSLHTFAHASPHPPFALHRFVRKAAVPKIQSAEKREKVPSGRYSRLLFQRGNNSFSVLRIDDCGAALYAGRGAAHPPRLPPPATRRPGARRHSPPDPCSPSGTDQGSGSRSLKCLAVQCPWNVGHLANVVPRPRAALRLAGFETRITETCGPPRALYRGTSQYQRAPGARKSYPLT